MLLREISYSILESLRAGSIVDDERFDIRLIDNLVGLKRVEYLKSWINPGNPISEQVAQSIELEMEPVATAKDFYLSSQTIPAIINSKFGHAIDELSTSDFSDLPICIVNSKHFRYTGNGKFNNDLFYCTYSDGKIYVKSNSSLVSDIETLILSAVFENPLDVPGFDFEADEYPIDLDGIEYIKKSIYNTDFKILLSGIADDKNDASGDI